MSSDDESDWDDDDESGDWDSDDETLPTILCPNCREEILEEAVRCPYCGNYASREELRGPERPMWFIVTAIGCIVLVLGSLWWYFV